MPKDKGELFVIYESEYHTHGRVLCVCATAEIAIQKMEMDGFRWCKDDEVWLNDKCKRFRRITSARYIFKLAQEGE